MTENEIRRVSSCFYYEFYFLFFILFYFILFYFIFFFLKQTGFYFAHFIRFPSISPWILSKRTIGPSSLAVL